MAGTICLVSTPVPTATASSPLILTAGWASRPVTDGWLRRLGWRYYETVRLDGTWLQDQSANVSVDFSYKIRDQRRRRRDHDVQLEGSITLYACGEIMRCANRGPRPAGYEFDRWSDFYRHHHAGPGELDQYRRGRRLSWRHRLRERERCATVCAHEPWSAPVRLGQQFRLRFGIGLSLPPQLLTDLTTAV